MPDSGNLFIVATPIGNFQDITLRALEILRSVDAVICEEIREGSTLLKKLSISDKEIISLNEHNEAEQADAIIIRLFQKQSFALISDCGTPVFADPGAALIRKASEMGIPIIPIPGPSSLMAALSILDVKLEKFVFAGFLERDPQQRSNELRRLRGLRMPVILMDTPYRLDRILDEVSQAYGKGQKITLACDMTLPNEKIFRGEVDQIRKVLNKRKAEFILIIHSGA
jgi:16S rRNA (cytidine1402-2'-O)-methyltransferase